MKYYLSLPFCITMLVATISCHEKDPAPALCKPHVLTYTHDSIIYNYESERIKTVAYYISGIQTNQDQFEYTGDFLTGLSKITMEFDGTQTLDVYYTIHYDNQGKPDSLFSDSYAGHFETYFTHENGRLTTATTVSGIAQVFFVGTTRYEFNNDGNVPKVFYTIRQNGVKTEVLARENLSFDDSEKFYANTPELRIVDEYVYGYLPGNNNCLSSTVYYYSYAQHFAAPQSVSFTSAYNDQGLIQTLQYEGTPTQLNSGEVLFNKVSYSCN
ncbi:MAG: hypothetical protein WDO14_14865 [Bacteroidota bacterium]